MRRIDLRMIAAAALMFAGAGLASLLTPTERIADTAPKVDLDTMIPRQFGDWSVDESVVPIQVSPDVQASLDKIYNQTLARTYVNSEDQRIMLSIAYGGDQSDALQAHFPEACYTAQGFVVEAKTRGALSTAAGTFPVARLIASLGPRNEPITYWISVGGRVAVDNWGMKEAKLAYTLKGQIPDGTLVRVSSISQDVKQAYELQGEFVEALLKAMPIAERTRLIGAAP